MAAWGILKKKFNIFAHIFLTQSPLLLKPSSKEPSQQAEHFGYLQISKMFFKMAVRGIFCQKFHIFAHIFLMESPLLLKPSSKESSQQGQHFGYLRIFKMFFNMAARGVFVRNFTFLPISSWWRVRYS